MKAALWYSSDLNIIKVTVTKRKSYVFPLLVFGELTPEDLLAMTRVCKSYYQFLSGEQRLWEKARLTSMPFRKLPPPAPETSRLPISEFKYCFMITTKKCMDCGAKKNSLNRKCVINEFYRLLGYRTSPLLGLYASSFNVYLQRYLPWSMCPRELPRNGRLRYLQIRHR